MTLRGTNAGTPVRPALPLQDRDSLAVHRRLLLWPHASCAGTPRCVPHRLLVRQVDGLAEEPQLAAPPGDLGSAASGGHEPPAPTPAQALRRLYTRQCSSDADLAALEAGLAAALGDDAAGSSPLSLYDLARVLGAFALAEWQPSALCLQRTAQWLTARAVAGAWLACERNRPAWCTYGITRAWARFAVWAACDTGAGADSVECRTLPGVADALQGYLDACGGARMAALEDVQRGIALELLTLDSVDALARAKRGTGSLWGVHCTFAALRRFHDGRMCAAHQRTRLRGRARVACLRPHACCSLSGRYW